MRHRRRGCALLVLAWLATGCVTSTAESLVVPIVTADGRPRPLARVALPLAELQARIANLRVERLAVYHEGRTPIPFAVEDEDADGRADRIVVVIPVAGDGSTRLLLVCPGPRAEGGPLAGGAQGAIPDFERAAR